MAIETFRVEGVSAEPYLHVIDLVKLGSRGAQVQETLFRMTGRRTVPNIFIGGKYIGGGDETVELHRGGKLKHLLEAASAVKQM
jgi:glutaredoxin 3